MYILYAQWKKDNQAEIWEVKKYNTEKEAIDDLLIYERGIGNIYWLWIDFKEIT